ncbi:alpha/beta fold hydrolase [Tomitella fengzijianii]|uniref:Alpha/beta fold hydrolase n=1 Tax=Tomitella fengzijianii TaxID=2597660 RepID=A0A516X565_9ACTN|nr:alpha/beta fold hydrolase [Tomitella fengzijianii]QDQ98206.1 alpha/beta fold hydrolase [Tomitella fengzijianii]
MAAGRQMDRYEHAGMTFDVIDSAPDAPDPDAPDPDASGHALGHAPDLAPVVLLHGFPQTAASWGAVTPQLNRAGYRTIAVNQRGYSPGARPRGRRAYRLELLMADVVALIERIGTGPVHLVGHDWGAAVAWMLAANRPDLVRTLTAVSVPHPGAFVRSMLSSTQAMHSYYMAMFQVPRLPEWVARRLPRVFDRMLRRTGMTDAMVERVRAEVIDAGALTGAINWYRAMPLTSPTMMNRPSRVPTTFVWSDGDVALTRRGAELTAEYVQADYRFEVLEDVSHWVPEEAPDALARFILERVEE